MPAFLSQDWLDVHRKLAADLPERRGATARLQIVVTGTPAGEVAYSQVFDEGRLVEAALGLDGGAEATLTQTYADAVAIAQGELDLSAGFMQGRVRFVGEIGALMAVMPLTQGPEHKAMLAALAAQTDF